MLPLKIAVLGSGKGSNFRAILNAAMAGQLKIHPVLAISDNADAGLLNLAEDLKNALQNPVFKNVARRAPWEK